MPLMLPRMPPFGNTSGLPPLLAHSHLRQSRWAHIPLHLPPIPPHPHCYFISPLQVSGHLAHDHHIEDPIKYPYLRKRDKQFPWGCKDCTLFDGACKVRSPASTFWSPLLFISLFFARLPPGAKLLTTNLRALSSRCLLMLKPLKIHSNCCALCSASIFVLSPAAATA